MCIRDSLYNDGELYYFMDMESYEQIPISKSVLDDNFKFVKENMECTVMSFKGNIFGVAPPNFVELQVTATDPGFKGDTATNVTKPATVETGAEIKVPLFIEEGEMIRIDTRTGAVSYTHLARSNINIKYMKITPTKNPKKPPNSINVGILGAIGLVGTVGGSITLTLSILYNWLI